LRLFRNSSQSNRRNLTINGKNYGIARHRCHCYYDNGVRCRRNKYTGCGNKKDPTTKTAISLKRFKIFIRKFSGLLRTIFDTNGVNFYKVSLLYAKMVRVIVSKDVFLSEHATVYLLSVEKSSLKIFLKTMYQLSNAVIVTSFCFVNKSCLFCE